MIIFQARKFLLISRFFWLITKILSLKILGWNIYMWCLRLACFFALMSCYSIINFYKRFFLSQISESFTTNNSFWRKSAAGSNSNPQNINFRLYGMYVSTNLNKVFNYYCVVKNYRTMQIIHGRKLSQLAD